MVNVVSCARSSGAQRLHVSYIDRGLAGPRQAAGQVQQAACLGTHDHRAVAERREGQLVAGFQAQLLTDFLGDGGLAFGGEGGVGHVDSFRIYGS